MKIEAGKYYLTRSGDMVGPMYLHGMNDSPYHKTHIWKGFDARTYDSNGMYDVENQPSEFDLVAEWKDRDTVKAPAPMTAIEHLRKACELFLESGNNKAAFDVLGLVIDYE